MIKSKKGVMLAIVLVVLMILSIFGVYIGKGVRQKIILVKRLSERSNLRLIAQAGVNKAIVNLSQDTSLSQDSFTESCFNDETRYKDIKIGLGSFDLCYNYNRSGVKVQICGIIDEARKINLNKADRNTLKRLFIKALSFDELKAQGLVASIIDFRDPDSTLSIPTGSAEDAYYRNLKEPYDCKDSDFEVIDEILLVKGMSRVYFEKLVDHVTIYGDGKVNLNTASSLVLQALGLSETVIDKIFKYRAGVDGIEGTVDDAIFASGSEIVSALSQSQSLSASELANISNLQAKGALSSSSGYFRADVRASLSNSEATLNVEAIFDRDGNIMFYREK